MASTGRGRAKRKPCPKRQPNCCSRVLPARLDALRHHIHAQHTGQLDDGADDLKRLIALGHAPHKRAIDLEDVEWKGVQVVERAVAGAEVVHKQGDAKPAQAAQHFESGAHIGDQAGFGHLEAELPAGDAEAVEQCLDVIGQSHARKLPGRELTHTRRERWRESSRHHICI